MAKAAAVRLGDVIVALDGEPLKHADVLAFAEACRSNSWLL